MNDNMIYYQSQPFVPIGNRAGQTKQALTAGAGKTAQQVSFQQMLSDKLNGLDFSQHAQERMKSRNIQLSTEEMQQLSDTVDKMAQKGARESLIYLNDAAFVISVKNRTVITAMDGASAKENIFTNIDSAVII